MTFSFSGNLPRLKEDIASSQLTGRFNDIKTHLDALQTLQAWTAVNTNQTIVNGSRLMITGVLDITLKSNPTLGDEFFVMPGDGFDFEANPIDLKRAASLEKINGYAGDDRLTRNGLYTFVYTGNSSIGWRMFFTPSVQILTSVSNGRLTLSSGVPVTTTNQTAKTTVYFTPYKGNEITLYDANRSSWILRNFTEKSVAVPSTTNTPFDIFAYWDSSAAAVALEVVNWTNATTRATAIVLTTGGIYTKNGDPSRKYLGTGCTTGSSGQCEDSSSRGLLWNYYNRILRTLIGVESTPSWGYTTNTFRPNNNSVALGVGRVDLVIGVSEDIVTAINRSTSVNAGGTTPHRYSGVGIDSTSVNSATVSLPSASIDLFDNTSGEYSGFLAEGYHYIQGLEYSVPSGTTTWIGVNNSVVQTGLIARSLM